MRLRLADIRPGERRDAFGAFLVLFGLLAGHSMLETARDALFLAKISPTRLPIAYVAIAAFAILFTQSRPKVARDGGRGALMASLAGAGVVTALFWVVAARAGEWALYSLYVWTGALATLLVLRFWILAGELFTITQAKRVFAFVGTGGILGAIAGSAIAQALTLRTDPVHLVLASAAVFLATSLAVTILRDRAGPAAPSPEPSADRESVRAAFRHIWSHAYLRRVACLVFVSSITFTLADFVFKSAIAREFAPAQLGYVFATTYLILNVASLLMQLVIVGLLVRSLSVDRVLAVTPALLATGAAWLAIGGATLAALAIKLVDGSLRHSLHRTASEVLYVPLSRAWRERAKGFIDVAAQRGGQVVAAVAFLAVGSMGMALPLWGAALVLLCGAWIFLASTLRAHYFDLFRSTLEEGMVQTRIGFPELDLASLETLIAALGSPNDAEVLAALDLLAEKERSHLVPVLILYHPSAAVLVRALELFDSAGRTERLPFLDRLSQHPNDDVRVAALISTPNGPEEATRYERALSDTSADVRATALVGLASSGDRVHPRVQSILETLVLAGSPAAKQALARAIARRPHERFDELLRTLAALRDPLVAREAARAIRARPREVFVAPLVDMLEWRDAREDARLALAAIGEAAFDRLARALDDEETAVSVRRHVPRSLSRFEPTRACDVLLARFPAESDATVRYKILRALGYVRSRHPGTRLDPGRLKRAAEGALFEVFQFTDWGARIETLSAPSGRMPMRALTLELLDHKVERAIEHLFRLFSLQYPREDFRRIHRGFLSSNRQAWASSRELVEHLLASPFRESVLAALDDVPPAQRVARAGRYYRRASSEGREALREVLRSGDLHLRCLAAHHVAELGLTDLGGELDALRSKSFGPMEASLRNVLEFLAHPERSREYVVSY